MLCYPRATVLLCRARPPNPRTYTKLSFSLQLDISSEIGKAPLFQFHSNFIARRVPSWAIPWLSATWRCIKSLVALWLPVSWRVNYRCDICGDAVWSCALGSSFLGFVGASILWDWLTTASGRVNYLWDISGEDVWSCPLYSTVLGFNNASIL